MFDRFIRLARAKKALQEQRFLDALQQASDALIEGDRRAERIRRRATEALLARVRSRLDGGDVATAQGEIRRLAQLVSSEEVQKLAAEVAKRAEDLDQAANDQQVTRAEFRKLLDRGELDAAEHLVASVDGVDGAEVQGMRERIAERRQQAAELARDAAKRARSSECDAAVDEYVRALAVDRDLAEPLRSDARAALADGVVRTAKANGKLARLSSPELCKVLERYRAIVARLPEFGEQPAVVELQGELAVQVETQLTSGSDFGEHTALAHAARTAEIPFPEAVDRVIAALVACEGKADPTQVDGAVLAQLQQAASVAGLRRIDKLASSGLRGAVVGEEQLHKARALLEQGKLAEARAMFVAFLNENPMHEGVQKELVLVDQGLADLDRSLADVRLALRAGRLREACTGAMALVGSARIAAEAKSILAEARSRMTLVDQGLDEVRVALHGRAAATQEGVRHCLKRLEELAKVQVDHEELPAVQAAVAAELDALALCEKANNALARADVEAVLLAVPDLVAARANLLGAERIDAKLCQLGDGVVQFGDTALAEGRLSRMQRCAAMLQQLEVVRDDFGNRAAEWQQAGKQRQAAVDALLTKARKSLAERDLAEAERLVEEAQAEWQESPDVHAFGQQLRKLRKQSDTLEQVATLTDEKDFLGAQQKLESMPNVPPMLRTRVYDMKQDLARAQGLEGAFLLRVDEGGEQLVMRGESVTIGNVRQARADLPVLANLAGRHASIRRSMSFHGGMQDSVVAEDGEVTVAGKPQDKHVLQSGDRVKLGPALGFVYHRPTTRSLTSRLTLQSGFQVAGTDRILLMKDRGRDGRILIGPGRDAHVTVSGATCEVEVFASNTGQMRVACEHGGTIDGAAFRGEHPLAAGQVVEAGGISFLLLPWRATS